MKLNNKQRGYGVLAILAVVIGGSWTLAPEPTPAKAFVPPKKVVVKKVVVKKRTPSATSRLYARTLLPFYGWNDKQFTCLNEVWVRESNWNNLAYNKTPVVVGNKKMNAYGIAQKLGEKNHDSKIQIKHGFDYIKERYGSPCQAWAFWQKHSWY